MVEVSSDNPGENTGIHYQFLDFEQPIAELEASLSDDLRCENSGFRVTYSTV